MSELELPNGEAFSFAVSGGKWLLDDTRARTRGAVATYYRGAALESKQVDLFYGNRVHNPLFSPANERQEELITKYGRDAQKLLTKFNELLFAVLAAVEVGDERSKTNLQLFPAAIFDKINKREEPESKEVKKTFVTKTAIEIPEEYFEAMKVSDMIFLPVVKSVRRRLKLLYPDRQLIRWEDYKGKQDLLQDFCQASKRKALADSVLKQTRDLHRIARNENPQYFTGGSSASDENAADKNLLQAIYKAVAKTGVNLQPNEQTNELFQALLRSQLVSDNKDIPKMAKPDKM